MYSINLVLRTNKMNKKGLCPVRLRIVGPNRARKEITIHGIRVKPECWDSDKQQIEDDDQQDLIIQQELKKYETAIMELKILKEKVSIDSILNRVNHSKNLNKKKSTANPLLTDCLKEFMEEDKKLAYATRRAIGCSRSRIDKLIPKTKISDVNGEFLNAFENTLKENGYAKWTIHTNLKHIKRAVSIAVEKGIIEPPSYYGHTMKRGKGAKEHLTDKELKLLMEYKPDTKSDQVILNAFLFSVFAGGARFTDCLLLTYKNIQTMKMVDYT